MVAAATTYLVILIQFGESSPPPYTESTLNSSSVNTSQVTGSTTAAPDYDVSPHYCI